MGSSTGYGISESKFPDTNHLKISIQTLVEKLYVKLTNFILRLFLLVSTV